MASDLERAVQWYPGHMVKAMRRIGEYLKSIDVVVEVVDARVPRSGRNPMLDKLAGSRDRLIVLNREDLADPHVTRRWVDYDLRRGFEVVPTVGRDQGSVSRLGAALQRLVKARRGTSRAIVVGLPNSGKSSIINGLIRRAAAKTEDRAGVTRQLQWFKLSPALELMDTPGILVPKIGGGEAQWKLAMVGAVPRERYDAEEIVGAFYRWTVASRRDPAPDLETFAKSRGAVRAGGGYDLHNAARSYITAFNEGAFGRISLEAPDDAEVA